MFTKILFTAAVIAGVIMLVRLRRRRPVGSTATSRAPESGPRTVVRWLAVAVVAVLLAGTTLYLYLDWRAAHELVEVRVIDARSGRSNTYQAYRGDLDARSFLTVDGRRVTLAETERMETSLTPQR